ncbi:MAG TPA: DUF4139 domain-containing protein [Polyangiaceae bacterium]
MQRLVRTVAGFSLLLACHCGAAPVAPAKGPDSGLAKQALPLEKVELYEAGVAYFERAGSVEGRTPLELVVPKPHFDDALRTLTVLSGGSRTVPSFDFATLEAREALLARLSLLKENGPIGYRSVMESLISSEVEVVSKAGRSEGRVVSITDAPPIPLADPDPYEAKAVPATIDDFYITLASRERGLQRFRGSEITRVRPRDPRRRELIDRALDDPKRRVAAPEHALALRVAKGPLRVGYVTEAPVWRALYRMLLPAAGNQARVAGNALVHNDGEERWANVELTFASARPDSFATRFGPPAYARRAALEGSEGFFAVPQLGSDGAVVLAPPTTHEATSKVDTLPTPSTGRRSPEAGSFLYRARERINLDAHASSLVPFLEAAVDARPLVWFAGPNTLGKRSVRVRNTTEQTLPEGPVAFFGPSGFAGETVLPRLLPGAAKLLSFADELDVELTQLSNESVTTLTAISFDDGTLTSRSRIRIDRKYQITNRKAEAVRVAVPVRKAGASRAADFAHGDREDPAQGVFDIAAGQSVTRQVVIDDEVRHVHAVESLASSELREFAALPAFAGAVRAILEAAAKVTDRIEANSQVVQTADERVSELDSEVSNARTDVSEAAKAGSAATRDLLARLAVLERERAILHDRSTALTKENERLVQLVSRELQRLPKTPQAAR